MLILLHGEGLLQFMYAVVAGIILAFVGGIFLAIRTFKRHRAKKVQP